MVKKAKKAKKAGTARSARKSRSAPAKKTAKRAKTAGRTLEKTAASGRIWSMSAPTVALKLSINEALALPRFACQKTAVAGVCLLFEYNNRSKQYDKLIGRTDCSSCTHFIEPIE